MLQFLNNMRISANTEIVCLLILGTVFQMTDGSPFQIKKKWETVWSIDLPREYFSPLVQQIIKTGLMIVVAARCGATYPYVVSAMIAIFCVIKDRAPKLILPWVFIAGMKSVCMTFFETLIGIYVCSAFGKIHKACIEFLISKAIEIIFAAYLWGSVLSVYQDLERRTENKKILKNPEISYIKKMDLKRKRARSLLDESTLYKTACLNNFEFKDVPQIILQMLRRADEMSQDSLLGPGMMLASVSNMGSFDNLKTSESLGELGSTNLQTTKVIGLDEEENLSPPEKALKFLKMTWSDVRRIKPKCKSPQSDLFTVNSDLWYDMTDSDAHIYKPKQARTEVFIRELPEVEFEEDQKLKKSSLKKIYGIKFGVSLFNLIKKCEFEYDEDDESFVDSQEETDEEEEGDGEGEEGEEKLNMSQTLMSNIKEEKPVNRIRLNVAQKQTKGRAYSKLYKKAFMNVIGPEVFDRATKLPKLTSFTVMNVQTEKTSASVKPSTMSSQSEMADPKTSEKFSSPETDFEKNDDDLSIRDPNKTGKESVDSPESVGEIFKEVSSFIYRLVLSKAAIKRSMKTLYLDSVEEPTENYDDVGQIESEIKESVPDDVSQKSNDQKPDDEPKSSSSTNSPPPVPPADVKKILPPCYRKRRVNITWIGKLKENNIECVSTDSSSSTNSDDSSECQQPPETDSDMDNADRDSEIKVLSSDLSIFSEKSEESEKQSGQDQEVYFLTEFLQKPLPEVLRKYYDLKNMKYVRRKRSAMSQKQLEFTYNLYKMYYLKRYEEMCEFGWKLSGERGKVWKSKVLKTAEPHQPLITGEFLNKMHQVVTDKLLRYQYLILISKIRERISNDDAVDESRKSIVSKEQSSTTLDSTKLRNERLCKSHSENLFQRHAILRADNNDSVYVETPSEHSVEVRQKDLNNGKTDSPTKRSASFEGCCVKKMIKSSAEKTNLGSDEDDSVSSEESDEPISLYYSKAANLASPLLDMKKFIYPDHIHYSYKHVNKKGFDVNISGGLPLLVQSQALSTSNNLHVKEISVKPESEITRRPMDLSFAKTDAFAEWQNSDQNVSDLPSQVDERSLKVKSIEVNKRKRERSSRKTYDGETSSRRNEANSETRTDPNSPHEYFAQNYIINEKLKKMSGQMHKKEQCWLTQDGEDRTPVQISSTQLHSNKGRLGPTYSPALRLQENRKEGKKKVETQEERTKEMLARLEREILFQNKSSFNSSKP